MIKKVNQYSIADVFSSQNNIEYRIPKYQREYIWGAKDWDALFDDVVDNEEGYFLGSYICVGTSAMGTAELEIIDGQQRFTSIALLLASLYSWLLEWKEEDELDEDEITDLNNLKAALANKTTTRKNGHKKSSYSPKLILQDQNYNRDDFESILCEYNIIDEADDQKYRGNRRIEKAFRHFDKRIAEYIEERLEENSELHEIDILFELISKFKAVILVGIEVDSHKDAYMLFESLNHRGVPLSAIDLIKNILIAEADEKGEADECYESWKEGLGKIGEDYTLQERFFRHWYNAFRDEFNEPFVSAKANKKYPLAYKATKSTLLDIYEKVIRKDYSWFMQWFEEEADIYSIIVNNSGDSYKYDEDLMNLERIQGAPSYLLLLYVLTKREELKLTDEHVSKIITCLITFFVRRHVTDIPATRNLDRIFMETVSDINDLTGQNVVEAIKKKLKSVSADDEVFEEKLKGPMYIDNDMATRFILCSIEAEHQTKEIYADLWSRNNSGIYVWTIEKVFPEDNSIQNK